MRLTTINRSLGVALCAALLLAGFAGPASADRLVDFSHNHVDGATVAAKLWQQGGENRGLYVEVRMRNTRRAPGCITGAVAWRRSGPDLVDFQTATPRPTPIRACAKRTWINVGRTAVRSVRDFSGVSTHVAVEGGQGKWDGMIGWDRRDVKRQADRFLNMSHGDFIRAKRTAMRNRARAGARGDGTWPLDWTDDGCSIPRREASDVARKFSRFFDQPCQQHDFGYRNYGNGSLALNPTEAARRRIDEKLRLELKRACRDNLRGFDVLGGCVAAGNVIANSVRNGGRKAFF